MMRIPSAITKTPSTAFAAVEGYFFIVRLQAFLTLILSV